MQIRIWRPELRLNLVLWAVGILIFIGLIGLVVWLALTMGPGGETYWLVLGIMSLVSVLGAANGWRKGEFSPTIVTVDGEGIRVEAKPAAQSWRLGWHEIGLIGVVRDVRDRPFVVFESADGRDRGQRSLLEQRLAAGFALPAHARSLQLPDELRAALDQHVAGGLRSYPMR